eukprot:scaffold604476_cov29-Prasinocladus_malaysianus.AAC.1
MSEDNYLARYPAAGAEAALHLLSYEYCVNDALVFVSCVTGAAVGRPAHCATRCTITSSRTSFRRTSTRTKSHLHAT